MGREVHLIFILLNTYIPQKEYSQIYLNTRIKYCLVTVFSMFLVSCNQKKKKKPM
ncbi:hypothetical protein HanIR_Chr10g0490791 [Helianthus annuus]|nr:hypothetical protein HanIR_Chr10g0490791 [Helianthus annuus]